MPVVDGEDVGMLLTLEAINLMTELLAPTWLPRWTWFRGLGGGRLWYGFSDS